MDDWWRTGVVYQVYPRSFADSNGDGVGDLAGLAEHLDHLQWLGVDAVWLTPITVSPDDDMGYDVADYTAVQPVLGDLDDHDRLVREAAARGLRLILDIVPNHTSDRHPWFRERPDWYVWTDRPNNWLSVFGGPAWTFDAGRGRYYLHQFLPSQPDLDWWNPEVRQEFERILRFWFDRGVAGFRIDCANRLVKDAQLRDNPPLQPDDHPLVQRYGQRPEFSSDRPEVHEVFRGWRRVCAGYRPERVLIGETWFFDANRLRAYYGSGDELQLAFNFLLTHAGFSAAELRSAVEAGEASLGPGCQPAWAAGNHDVSRFATRWGAGDRRRARLALLMLLTLRGTPFLYYGDELALEDVPVPPERARDPLFHRFPGRRRGRDPERTPMPWQDGPGAGFTAPGVQPWLPIGGGRSVAAQRADGASQLHLTRDLLALRRARGDLNSGAYRTLPAPASAWCYARGDSTRVALNFSGRPMVVEPGGDVLLGTDRRRDGQAFDGRLAAWEGVVLGP